MTVTVPLLRTLGSPGAWADHIDRHAREQVSNAVDLVVTTGSASEAGISLVKAELAAKALLLNPEYTLAAGPVGTTESEKDDKLAGFFLALGPELISHLSEHGTLSDDGIAKLVDAILENDEHLQPADRELMRSIASEQMADTFPLDVEAQGRPPPKRKGWIDQLADVGSRCAVAISGESLYRRVDLSGMLRTVAPEVEVVELTSLSSSIWLHDPREGVDLIQELLER